MMTNKVYVLSDIYIVSYVILVIKGISYGK